MTSHFIQVDDLRLNLALLVRWEWREDMRFLTLHMVNGTTEYVRDELGEKLYHILDNLIVLRIGISQGRKKERGACEACSPDDVGLWHTRAQVLRWQAKMIKSPLYTSIFLL